MVQSGAISEMCCCEIFWFVRVISFRTTFKCSRGFDFLQCVSFFHHWRWGVDLLIKRRKYLARKIKKKNFFLGINLFAYQLKSEDLFFEVDVFELLKNSFQKTHHF